MKKRSFLKFEIMHFFSFTEIAKMKLFVNFLCNRPKYANRLVILFLVLFYNIESANAKIKYSELLTNDNELLLIESSASVSTKLVAPAGNAAIKMRTQTIARKAAAANAKAQHNKTSGGAAKHVDKNKLIVNVVYASSNSAVAAALRSDPTKLVYSTSESLNACDKNSCKSNEVCRKDDKKYAFFNFY